MDKREQIDVSQLVFEQATRKYTKYTTTKISDTNTKECEVQLETRVGQEWTNWLSQLDFGQAASKQTQLNWFVNLVFVFIFVIEIAFVFLNRPYDQPEMLSSSSLLASLSRSIAILTGKQKIFMETSI